MKKKFKLELGEKNGIVTFFQKMRACARGLTNLLVTTKNAQMRVLQVDQSQI